MAKKSKSETTIEQKPLTHEQQEILQSTSRIVQAMLPLSFEAAYNKCTCEVCKQVRTQIAPEMRPFLKLQNRVLPKVKSIKAVGGA